ncbi:MAG: DEAD/DEAH box helicase family protein [Anaerolineales bacterium]|nr:DEAD/DEAH box helicase family protein [Anaerolineales bacterium]
MSIVSAYFTIYAFETLKDHLLEIDSLNFLFGEPRFVRSLDPEKTDKKAFKIEDDGLKLANRHQQKRIAKECADWIRQKVQIKSIKQANLLHGKMYHIDTNGREKAILGSSNFTVSGLGLSDNNHNNIELNLVVDSERDRNDLKAWFDELWHNEELVEDVKAEVLRYLEQLYQNHAPEFIYFKTLFHIFEKYLAEQEQSGLLSIQSQVVDTDIWKALFEFQKDGVKAAINKILTHNGCIIADSVGLGKTYEALAIIKYFELRNHKVLVLCPKKLRENWTVYLAHVANALNPFVNDRFSYTVLSHTDLSRDGGRSGDIDLSTVNWGNFDLVVIDESHNFRNNTRGRRDEAGEVMRKSRYERLMEDIIKSGVKTKVLLLSATPVNNDLRDLRNQIYFLTEGQDDAFRESMGIANLQYMLAEAQRSFAEWSKTSQTREVKDLLDRLSSSFFKLLDELTIARSRKHIHRYYQDSIAEMGGFPDRLKPISVYPEIDLKRRFMAYDRLNQEISQYKLSLFNPSAYVKPEYWEQYQVGRVVQNFTQRDREHFLIGMMKVNFLKRLESSVHSFAITLERTISKIEQLQDQIERFERLRAGQTELDLDTLAVDALDDEDLEAVMQVGIKFRYNLAHLDRVAWLADLEKDRQQLLSIYSSAHLVTPEHDAKLAELKKLIAQKVKQPTLNRHGQPNRKVLVFTAFADTAIYLYDNLRDWARQELKIHLALVTGGTVENKTSLGRNEFSHILTNFSPIAKRRAKIPGMPQNEEIDLLIATDCISEGQNLQDCDYLINYDIHWNPVRIIQRFGRIDRIGSLNTAVQLVNFWPTPDLNQYINLKNRVEARMALVDIAATFEDNLLAAEALQEVVAKDLSYRDQQLLRFKDEVLDLEDFNETVTLNEFTLDDFRIELSKYIESNRQLLHDAPLGLYAVVPADPTYPVIAPGVIYCLRQKGDTAGNEAVNPLQPYFLIYVREDKQVRFSFAQPKQILEIYRHLCLNKTTPYQQLCDLFDQETQHGNDMALYNELLEKAVASIEQTFTKRNATQLISGGRGGVLVAQQKQVSQSTDFDLITWLVIKE